MIPVSAVIAEAIEDALFPFGVRIERMPLMPYEVLGLIEAGPTNAAASQVTSSAQTLEARLS